MAQKGFLNNLIIIGILVILSGVGGYLIFNNKSSIPTQTPAPTSTSSPTSTTTPNPSSPSATPVPAALIENPKNIPQTHNAFGFNIFKNLKMEEGNKNIFISPSSIAIALSMVLNGAKGDTKNAIQKTLVLNNLDINTVNGENLNLINILKNPDPKVELSVANSVWVRKGVDFKQDFLNLVKNYYQAEIQSLDFASPSSVEKINLWVSQNTKGKIPMIIQSIPSEMMMYLINAVYFKGSWTKEFDKKLTEDRNFTPVSGTPNKRSLMKLQNEDLPYLETDTFQSIGLSYGENKRLSMYVFLPKNLDNFINSLSPDNWNKWMKQYQITEGTVLLPKFKMEYETGLIGTLTKLGMGIAFQSNADFSGIGEELNISEVKHKTYVDVNEEGTEAAAVTSVGISITAIGAPKKTFYMEVNKPFFFAIMDNQTEEILFMGIVQNP